MSFYGPGPAENGDWLKVPKVKFWAYVQMLPRLQAERDLDHVSALLASEGRSLSESSHRDYMRALREAAAGGKPQRGQRISAAQAQRRLGLRPAPEKTERG